MNQNNMLDLVVVMIANWINLVLCLIFLNRVFRHAKWEHQLGYATIIMAIPLCAIAWLNFSKEREWAFGVLPLVLVVYLILEFILDYVLKLDFRRTALLGPYLLVYYLALFAMIGYAYMVSKTYGFITLITYFMNLAATFYSYSRVRHGV